MTRLVELVPLECVQCNSPIPADADDTAWICKTCGTGLYLDEVHGLQSLHIRFGKTRRKKGIGWLPFWVGQGKVEIHKRETYVGLARMASNLAKTISDTLRIESKPEKDGEDQGSLEEKLYSANDDSSEFWNKPKTFFIPAFDCTLEDSAAWGALFLQSPVEFDEGRPRPMEPVTINKKDASALAEFVVLSMEANKQDKLRSVEFTLKLDDLILWVIPVFVSEGQSQLVVRT